MDLVCELDDKDAGIHFLHRSAHFLLGISRVCDAALKQAEKLVSWHFEPSQPQRITSVLKTMCNLSPIYSACKSSNHKLSPNHKTSPDTNLLKAYTNIKHRIFEEGPGWRNTRIRQRCSPKLNQFKSTAEIATSWVICLASDLSGPRGDEKNGCRLESKEYCCRCGKKSEITSYRQNRFNCYFEVAAATVHHTEVKLAFLSILFASHTNLKMQRIEADLQDEGLIAPLCVVAIFYPTATGPYWALLYGDVPYIIFNLTSVIRTHASIGARFKVVQLMHDPNFSKESAKRCTTPF